MRDSALRLLRASYRHKRPAPTFTRPFRTLPSAGVIDADLELLEGTITGLVGVNGAGKTTLLRMIAGVLPIESGEVEISGKRVEVSLQRSRIGHMPEQVRWQGESTVEQALNRISLLRGGESNLDDLIQITGLSRRREDTLDTLSQGMRQRLSLAAALMGNPRILLLDEPLNGLDPVAQKAMIGLLNSLKEKGVAILVSSHQLAEISSFIDRIAVVHHGQVIAQGSVKELQEELGLSGRFRIEGSAKGPSDSIQEGDRWIVNSKGDRTTLLRSLISAGYEVDACIPIEAGLDEILEALTGADSLDVEDSSLLPFKKRGEEE